MLRSMGLTAALVVACAIAPTAHAQTSGRDAEARALFQAGQVAFEEGRYENALEYFRRSYELSQRPELLYNIGSAADRLRLDADALRAFEQYLELRPDAPNRAELEGRIAVLRRAVAAAGATTATTTAATTTTATTTDTPPDQAETQAVATTSTVGGPSAPAGEADAGPGPMPWIVLGAGAAVAVTGVILIGVAAGDVAAVENAPQGSSWSDVSAAYDRSEPLSIAGAVLIGVGGAAMIGGLVWGVVGGSSSSSEQPQAELTIGPGSVGVRGRF